MVYFKCIKDSIGKWKLGEWGQPLFTKEKCEAIRKKYATGPQR